jgi:DnaJ-class molecular chaperone
MESVSAKNYYQTLEVDPKASKMEIEKAFELAKKTYSPDSLATHSLMSPAEGMRILSKIKEAYQVLIDDDSRRIYDQYLLKSSREFVKSQGVGRQMAMPANQSTRGNPLSSIIKRTTSSGSGAGKGTEKVDTPPGMVRYDGAELKRIREENGIELRTVAEKTKINITTLKFIEENNFKLLPAPFYVKNFLIQYCKCIGLDHKKVTENYMKLYTLHKEGKK